MDDISLRNEPSSIRNSNEDTTSSSSSRVTDGSSHQQETKITTFPNAPTNNTPRGTLPLCRYGSECFRKNPNHFLQFDHPHLKNNNPDPLSEIIKGEPNNNSNSNTSNNDNNRNSVDLTDENGNINTNLIQDAYLSLADFYSFEELASQIYTIPGQKDWKPRKESKPVDIHCCGCCKYYSADYSDPELQEDGNHSHTNDNNSNSNSPDNSNSEEESERIILTSEQEEVYKLVMEGKNVFFTGSAGV